MKLKEEQRDIFTVPANYFLAHCISSDFAMGAGIAVEFVLRFGTKEALRKHFPYYEQYWVDRANRNASEERSFGDCLLEGRVLNLVTKRNYWDKPTYGSMHMALEAMREVAIKNDIKGIAMPRIGCGLDRLYWGSVREMINDVFHNTDIEILVCEKQTHKDTHDSNQRQ